MSTPDSTASQTVVIDIVVLEPADDMSYQGSELDMGANIVCCDCNAVIKLKADTASVPLGYGQFHYYCKDCEGVLL